MDRTNEEKPNAQIMKTQDAFLNDDNFDQEEAFEIMKRLFRDTRSTNTL